MASRERHIPLPVEQNADVALERAFALVRQTRLTSSNVLREAIWAYVDDAKTRDAPPERVIVGVKEIARRAGLTSAPGPKYPGGVVLDPELVLTRAVTWCIERYYAGRETTQ